MFQMMRRTFIGSAIAALFMPKTRVNRQDLACPRSETIYFLGSQGMYSCEVDVSGFDELDRKLEGISDDEFYGSIEEESKRYFDQIERDIAACGA